MPVSQTLILTAATGYGWDEVETFLLSLRRTGYDGRVALLVENHSLTTPDRVKLAEVDAELIPVYPILSHLPTKPARARYRIARWLPPSIHRAMAAQLRPNIWLHPIMSARFFFFRDVLARKFKDVEHVILSDVRDVAFQTNPADALRPDSVPLNLFSEQLGRTLGNDAINRHWINHLFGADCLARISNATVSCAGVVSGTRDGVRHYVNAMCEQLAPLAGAMAGRNGYDQGVHNYLIANDQFPEAKTWANGAGMVIHLEGLEDHEYSLDHDGFIRAPDGRIPPMIHQYDRYPHMLQAVRKRLDLNPLNS